MARKQRKSDFDHIVEAFSRLPWQVCLGLALVAYLVFHWLASMQPPPVKDMSQLGNTVGITVFRTAGLFLQFIAPFGLCLAALMSWLAKRRRTGFLATAERNVAGAPLTSLSWREFEQLVGAHFERLGYGVRFTSDGADGGVDVELRKGRETHLVQCKQWRGTQVGVKVVRELFGVMSARGAAGGYVVSIGDVRAANSACVGGNAKGAQSTR